MRPRTLVPILMAGILLMVTALPLEAQRRRVPTSRPPTTGVRALPVKTTTVPMRVLANALSGVVRRGSLSANACGGSNRNRKHSVSVAGYWGGGSMSRLEYRLASQEFEDAITRHSLMESHDPMVKASEGSLWDLPKTGHPSPIIHTITRVRMCVERFSRGGWTVEDPRHTAIAARLARSGGPQLVVRVPLSSMRFKGRGMPAEFFTGGVLGVDGLNLGIKWGHRITDLELPDYVLNRRHITVALAIVDDGRGGLTYGAVRGGFGGGWGPGWTQDIGNYAPSSVQTRLLRYRNQELQRLKNAVEVAFRDGRTRSTVSRALNAAVRGAPYRVGSIVSIAGANGSRGGEPALVIRYR